MNPHDTYHEGYFLLILGLPPDDEHNSSTENEKQHQESQAPRFPSGDGVDTVRGQNTQAQDEECCGDDVLMKQNQHMTFTQTPAFKVYSDIKFFMYLLCQILKFFTAIWKDMPDFRDLRIPVCSLMTVSSLEGSLPSGLYHPAFLPVSDDITWIDGTLSRVASSLFFQWGKQVCSCSAVVDTVHINR